MNSAFDHGPDQIVQSHITLDATRPPFVLGNASKQKIPSRTGGGDIGSSGAVSSRASQQHKKKNGGVSSSLSGALSVTDELLGRSPSRRHVNSEGGFAPDLVPSCYDVRGKICRVQEQKNFSVCPTPESVAFFGAKRMAKPPPDPAHSRFIPAVVLPQHTHITSARDPDFFVSAQGRQSLLQPQKQLLTLANKKGGEGHQPPQPFSSVKIADNSELRARRFLDDIDGERIVAEHKKGLQLAKLHRQHSNSNSGAGTPRTTGAVSSHSNSNNIYGSGGVYSSLSQASGSSSVVSSGRRKKNTAAVVVASPPPENDYVDDDALVTDTVFNANEINKFEQWTLPPVVESQKQRAAAIGKECSAVQQDMGESVPSSSQVFHDEEFGEMAQENSKSTHIAGPTSPDETATARVARSQFQLQLCGNLEVMKRLQQVPVPELEMRMHNDFLHRRGISKEDFFTFLDRLLRNVSKSGSVSFPPPALDDDDERLDAAAAKSKQQKEEQQQQPAYSVNRREVDLLFGLLDPNRVGIVETKELRSQLLHAVSSGGVSPADMVAFSFIASLLEGREASATNAFISRFDLQTICSAVLRRFDKDPEVVRAVSALPDSFNFKNHLARVGISQFRDAIFDSATLLTVFQACALDARRAKSGGSGELSASAQKHFAPPSIPHSVKEQQLKEQQSLLSNTSSGGHFSVLHNEHDPGNSVVMHSTLDGAAASQVSAAAEMPSQQSALRGTDKVMGISGNFLKGGTAITQPVLVRRSSDSGAANASSGFGQREDSFSENGGGGGGRRGSGEASPTTMEDPSSSSMIMGDISGVSKRKSPDQNNISSSPPAPPPGQIRNGRRRSTFAPPIAGNEMSDLSIRSNKSSGESKPKRDPRGSIMQLQPIVSADKFVCEDQSKQNAAEEAFSPKWYVKNQVLYRMSQKDHQPRPVFVQKH